MKRNESIPYMGRVIFRRKKGDILIYKDGVLTGYANSVKNAKALIKAKENHYEDNLL